MWLHLSLESLVCTLYSLSLSLIQLSSHSFESRCSVCPLIPSLSFSLQDNTRREESSSLQFTAGSEVTSFQLWFTYPCLEISCWDSLWFVETSLSSSFSFFRRLLKCLTSKDIPFGSSSLDFDCRQYSHDHHHSLSVLCVWNLSCLTEETAEPKVAAEKSTGKDKTSECDYKIEVSLGKDIYDWWIEVFISTPTSNWYGSVEHEVDESKPLSEELWESSQRSLKNCRLESSCMHHKGMISQMSKKPLNTHIPLSNFDLDTISVCVFTMSFWLFGWDSRFKDQRMKPIVGHHRSPTSLREHRAQHREHKN